MYGMTILCVYATLQTQADWKLPKLTLLTFSRKPRVTYDLRFYMDLLYVRLLLDR